jgi:hypothetical protein
MDGRVLETGAHSALYVEPTVNLPPGRDHPSERWDPASFVEYLKILFVVNLTANVNPASFADYL